MASLEEGKAEALKVGRGEGRSTGDGADGIVAEPEDPVEDLAPGIELIDEEMDPGIKCGDSDLPMIAESINCTGAGQISEQYSQDKTQGIGSERDQDIWKEGMCVPTRSAKEARDG